MLKSDPFWSGAMCDAGCVNESFPPLLVCVNERIQCLFGCAPLTRRVLVEVRVEVETIGFSAHDVHRRRYYFTAALEPGVNGSLYTKVRSLFGCARTSLGRRPLLDRHMCAAAETLPQAEFEAPERPVRPFGTFADAHLERAFVATLETGQQRMSTFCAAILLLTVIVGSVPASTVEVYTTNGTRVPTSDYLPILTTCFITVAFGCVVVLVFNLAIVPAKDRCLRGGLGARSGTGSSTTDMLPTDDCHSPLPSAPSRPTYYLKREQLLLACMSVLMWCAPFWHAWRVAAIVQDAPLARAFLVDGEELQAKDQWVQIMLSTPLREARTLRGQPTCRPADPQTRRPADLHSHRPSYHQTSRLAARRSTHSLTPKNAFATYAHPAHPTPSGHSLAAVLPSHRPDGARALCWPHLAAGARRFARLQSDDGRDEARLCADGGSGCVPDGAAAGCAR